MAVAVRSPLRAPFQPGWDQATMNSNAVGFMRCEEELGFPALPFVVLAGASVTSDPILACGFNNFMWVLDYAGGGGTTSFDYLYLDQSTQAVLFTANLGVLAPGFGVIPGFAMISATANFLLQLRMTANAANQTYSALRLWLTRR